MEAETRMACHSSEGGNPLAAGSGKTPPALVIIYLAILAWAILSWI
jgi:hypothetical protein